MGLLKTLGKIGVAALNPLGTAGYIAYKSLTKEGRQDLEDSVDEMIDDTFDAAEKVYDTASDTYNTVTGRNLVNEARERGERLKSRAEDIQYEYEYHSMRANERINGAIQSINDSKRNIKENLFRELADKLGALKNYKIEDYPLEQHFYSIREVYLSSNQVSYIEPIQIPGVNVFLPMLMGLPGFLGGYLYNRHIANEINEELDKKEYIIQEAADKCSTELRRLNLIEASITNICVEFRNLENIFKRVVTLIDEPIEYMKNNGIHKFSLLPKDQKEKFEAVIKIKDILKGVVERQIFKSCNQYEVQQYEREIKNISSNARLELEKANVSQQQYAYSSASSYTSDKSYSSSAKFSVTNVYQRSMTSAKVVVNISCGVLNVGDRVFFTANSGQEYGPYRIAGITPNGINCEVLKIENTSGNSLTNTIFPGWNGYK